MSAFDGSGEYEPKHCRPFRVQIDKYVLCASTPDQFAGPGDPINQWLQGAPASCDRGWPCGVRTAAGHVSRRPLERVEKMRCVSQPPNIFCHKQRPPSAPVNKIIGKNHIA